MSTIEYVLLTVFIRGALSVTFSLLFIIVCLGVVVL